MGEGQAQVWGADFVRVTGPETEGVSVVTVRPGAGGATGMELLGPQRPGHGLLLIKS